MVTRAEDFIKELATQHRVILIGGLAVIAYGYNRPTMDADIWLDPMQSAGTWADALQSTCARFPELTTHTLPGWRQIFGTDIAEAADDVGMVRILGLDCPLDVFRRPNEFPEDHFDEVYDRAAIHRYGTRLPDPLDLIITKLNTGRDKDLNDSRHLESIVRQRYREILPSASLAETKKLFDRYIDWEVCSVALSNPDQSVRDYVVTCLREMAADGDPFAQALIENKKIPYTGS